MKKRILTFVLAAFMVVGLAACGNSGEANGTEGKNTDNTPKWEVTNDAEAFAQSAAFAGEFYFAQGGDYTFEMQVDWETGNWTFMPDCPAAPKAVEHVKYQGTDFEFDEETNTFSFIYKDDVNQTEILFYSAYDEASNTYYINMYRNFNEFVMTPATWTPDVKFEYAE